MNKRLIGIITIMLALLLTTGCGNNTNNEVNTNNNGGKDNSSNTSSSNDVCPGCVYAYKTGYLYMADYKVARGKSEDPSVLTKDDYKTDYKEVMEEYGTDVFLGLKLNKKGNIEKAYACKYIESIQKPVCFERSTDGKLYESNRDKLKSLAEKIGYTSCRDYSDYYSCSSTAIAANIYKSGRVNVASYKNDNTFVLIDVHEHGLINTQEKED